MTFLGETIAIGTVLCWTISVQFFEAATKRAGSTPVNIIRIGLAVLFFAVFLLFRDGQPIPYYDGDKRHRDSPNKNDGTYIGPSQVIATP